MARRNELGSIASGIVGSFCSRNNDIDGYWALGKLNKLVENLPNKEVKIELLSCSVYPLTNEFDELIEFYRKKLFEFLASRSIPRVWIESATILSNFELPENDANNSSKFGVGSLCQVQCKIVDDNGRSHNASNYTRCMPHDPKREMKSSRA